MRLFTGLDIPDQSRAAIDDLIGRLKPLAPLRWSRAANLHVTTKFIGEWPESRLDELKSALAAVPGTPTPVRLEGLGWFPNPHQPRIFWIAIKSGPELPALAAETSRRLAALGIAEETRAYTPHLTVARVGDHVRELAPVRRAVASLPATSFGEFVAREFFLYLSEPSSGGGSQYTKLASFPLGVSA